MTQQKFSMSSVEEDEEVRRSMEALGLAPPRAPEHYQRVDNELDNSLERRAAALKNKNGNNGSKAPNLEALTRQRDAERREQNRQAWIDHYQRMIDVLEDNYTAIKERHEARIKKLKEPSNNGS